MTTQDEEPAVIIYPAEGELVTSPFKMRGTGTPNRRANVFDLRDHLKPMLTTNVQSDGTWEGEVTLKGQERYQVFTKVMIPGGAAGPTRTFLVN